MYQTSFGRMVEIQASTNFFFLGQKIYIFVVLHPHCFDGVDGKLAENVWMSAYGHHIYQKASLTSDIY